MQTYVRHILIGVAVALVLVLVMALLLARKAVPEHVQYGISFNTPYAQELGLDVKEVYDAFLDELGVRHLRLAAHWTIVEPHRDVYDFAALDYQLKRAEEVGAEVVFGVGRRLPRWPECHVPEWARGLEWEVQKEELRAYIEAVVTRYKKSPAIKYWQVENEPYLGVFAHDHCGDLDEAFLAEEIALVQSLDDSRPVLVTDSGNLGTWKGAYSQGDVFGTSVYVYFWNPELGQFKTVLPPWFYRLKEGIVSLLYGEKETMLIELSAEPWLLEPVTSVPIDVQYSRMDLQKFNEILEYAEKTRYEKQYLWGGEWWYWLRERGHTDMWERGVELFN
ncbi:MAG: beta-galactosidase [Candidatus Pacebacteria bacterium]|nr:beta-galactosidase [Candidatus Paceibacterota bacterium]